MGFVDFLGSVVQQINPLGWAEKAYNWIGENYKPVLDTIKKVGSKIGEVADFIKPITQFIPGVSNVVDFVSSAAKGAVNVSDTLNSIGDRVYQRQESIKPAMSMNNNGSSIERMSMRPASTSGMEYAKPLGRR